MRPLMHRIHEAKHFIKRFALDPQRHDDRPQFQIGDPTIEHG